MSAHGHAHDHAHQHGAPTFAGHADASRLTVALGLLAALMAGEIVAGILASSLALLSDAAHLLVDVIALALSLLAMRLARRPAAGALTFGLRRGEILAAQFNGATLLVLAVLIVYEGVRRLIDPPGVDGAVVVGVALTGVVVNLVATRVMAGADRESLNVEGAYQHILTDLIGFALTAVAGAVILTAGFDRADGIASLVLAAIMLRSAYGLLRASGRVFLEASPEHLDPDEIGRALVAQDGVVEVHDLHVWEISSGFPALAAHITVREHDLCHGIREDLERVLRERFGIDHTTLQVDHRQPAELLEIQPTPPAAEPAPPPAKR